MEKIIVILLVIIQVGLLSSCNSANKTESYISSQFTETAYTMTTDQSVEVIQSTFNLSTNNYVNNLEYVREKIKSVLTDDEYQDCDLSDRKMLIEPILEQLLKDGYITSYRFELDIDRPYASYDYVGGGSGAVFLEEFPKNQN